MDKSVVYTRHGSVTAKKLIAELDKRNYDGKIINWGNSQATGDVINLGLSVALASHKKRALKALESAGVKTLLVTTRLVYSSDLPVVGRKSYHSDGSDFYLCYTLADVKYARHQGVTHFQRYLDNAREFRVHIINGKSVRVSERYGNKHVTDERVHTGGKFRYPREFERLPELREVAREAVIALGLDFGAVDILYDGDTFYTLEVNSAPSLATCWSHVLPQYVEAFLEMESAHNHQSRTSQELAAPRRGPVSGLQSYL